MKDFGELWLGESVTYGNIANEARIMRQPSTTETAYYLAGGWNLDVCLAPVGNESRPFRHCLEFTGSPVKTRFDLTDLKRAVADTVVAQQVRIQSFAEKYGPLGRALFTIRSDVASAKDFNDAKLLNDTQRKAVEFWRSENPSYEGLYEETSDWQREIMNATHAFAIVEALESGEDLSRTADWVRDSQHEGRWLCYLPEGFGSQRSLLVGRTTESELIEFDGGNFVTKTSARLALRKYLSREISEGIDGQVTIIPNISPSKTKGNFTILPRTLAGVIWMSFQLYASGKLEIRTCPECGQEFAVTGTQRSKKNHCSEACYNKAYYKKSGGGKHDGTSQR